MEMGDLFQNILGSDHSKTFPFRDAVWPLGGCISTNKINSGALQSCLEARTRRGKPSQSPPLCHSGGGSSHPPWAGRLRSKDDLEEMITLSKVMGQSRPWMSADSHLGNIHIQPRLNICLNLCHSNCHKYGRNTHFLWKPRSPASLYSFKSLARVET